jgi:hypothetical protein
VLSAQEAPAVEKRLLHFLVAGGDHKSLILGTLKDDFLTDPRVKTVVAALREAEGAAEPIDFQGQIAHLTDEERTFLSGIALDDSPEPTEKGVDLLLKDLEKKYLDREGAEIQRAIDRAAAGPELEELMRRKQEISRRRAELGRPRGKDDELGHRDRR